MVLFFSRLLCYTLPEVIVMTRWIIRPMLQKDAWEIFRWKYEGIYAFYNHMDESAPPESPEASLEDSFVVCCNDGQIIGHLHFGEDGRIPTEEKNVYPPDYLDIGLGMRPDLCGKGNGAEFVKMGLAFAKEKYDTNRFRLSVAAFNERAIKVYERSGFVKRLQVTNAYFKNQFYIMTTV